MFEICTPLWELLGGGGVNVNGVELGKSGIGLIKVMLFIIVAQNVQFYCAKYEKFQRVI